MNLSETIIFEPLEKTMSGEDPTSIIRVEVLESSTLTDPFL